MSRSIFTFIFLTFAALSCAAQKTFELDGNRLKVDVEPSFINGTDKINTLFDDGLKHVRDYLNAKSYITAMRVESHVDASAKNGQELSEKRAMVVAKWLVENGIDCKRLIAVGFGSTKPLNISGAGTGPGNVRIEFFNAALAGHPIGGLPLDGGGKSAGDVCKQP